METLKQFQITGITLSGFKCYPETTELTFGCPTVITGGNGRGKTSIADAIAFAVTGLPFFGERGIDRLHSEQNPDLSVTMHILDEANQPHTLTRARQKGRMTITYDGMEVRQHELTGLFGEKDVFLSIFNPLYFIEELGEDGKSLLERYLPRVSHEQVLSQLNENTRANLQSEDILSPEAYLKKRREEIRELEQRLVYLQGQKDQASRQRRSSAVRLTDLKRSLAELQGELASLEKKRFEGVDLAGLQEQLVELSERYQSLVGEAPEAADTSELDMQLRSLHQKLGARTAEAYLPKYTQPLADCTARVKELAAKYRRETSLYKAFRPGTQCPTCLRPVTEQDVPMIQNALQKTISETVAAGKEAKAQLEELTALERKTEETFLQFQAEDVEKYRQEIDRLTQDRDARSARAAQIAQARKEELDGLQNRIRALSAETECGCLSAAEYERLLACRSEIQDCKAQIAAAQAALDAEPEDYDAKRAQIEAEIRQKKSLLADAALYISKRAELTFSQLKMNLVEISLYDVVRTTGEVKDVFKFNYRGRRYDRLSLSEKIRAGMEVSELMKRLTGRNYPVFLDNMESVDDLANVRPTGQIIMAKCVHGAPLAVRPMEQRPMPKAA